MANKYKSWICKVDKPTGRCKSVTLEMVAKFPELTPVRGHYICPVWGERQHWWTEDRVDTVYDPTAKQFQSEGSGVYIPWDESSPEPTGKCPQCSELIYDGQVTHEACASVYAAYCMSGVSQ